MALCRNHGPHTPLEQVFPPPQLEPSTSGTPGLQVPEVQASPKVQGLRSSQGPEVLAAWAQPVVGSQVSVVQEFLSSQSVGGEEHLPARHLSGEVQALESVQGVWSGMGRFEQPVFGAQVSVVQGFWSLHASRPEMLMHPVLVSHKSIEHLLPSSQLLKVCTAHFPIVAHAVPPQGPMVRIQPSGPRSPTTTNPDPGIAAIPASCQYSPFGELNFWSHNTLPLIEAPTTPDTAPEFGTS